MRLIPNFLNEDIFKQLQGLLLSHEFPYYYLGHTGSKHDKSDFYFEHMLYDNQQQTSPSFHNLLMPIIGQMNYNLLIRAKINMYTKKDKEIYTDMHVDHFIPHQVALFAFNTNNGFTAFEDGEKIPSVANQLAIFDGSRKHCSVAQTDENLRINLNINIQ